MKIISPIISAGSGSIAGLTASRNRGGLYFRARAIPTNPATSFQQSVRNAMTNLVTRWSSVLTQAQRDGWQVYADNTPVFDTLGQAQNLSGQQMFIRSNVEPLTRFSLVNDDAPTVFDLGPFTTPTLPGISEATQTFDFTIDNTDAWANEDNSFMLVYLSRPQNPGVNFFKGPYRFAGSVAGNSVTPPVNGQSITPIPFAVVEDQRMFVKYTVTRADGRYSSPTRDGFIVAA